MKSEELILVTGGTGLVGSHLLYELTKAGNRVRAIRRATSDTGRVRKIFSYYTGDPESLLGNIEWVEADLLDYSAMEDAMEGVSGIYHLAGVVSFYPKDHKRMLRVNIDGTANLVNLALDKKDVRLCYISSVSALGLPEKGRQTDEETHWKASRRNSIYAVSKYGAEREIWRGIEEGLKAGIVIPSIILGPGFWYGNSGLFRLIRDGMRYYTQGINGYVDVRDVARAMILLMEKELFGDRFILSSENLSYRELFSLMAKYLGKPAPSVSISPAMASVLWRGEAMISFLKGKKPLLSKELLNAAIHYFPCNSEKIKSRLEFTFRPVEQSIREFCSLYLKEQGEVSISG